MFKCKADIVAQFCTCIYMLRWPISTEAHWGHVHFQIVQVNEKSFDLKEGI